MALDGLEGELEARFSTKGGRKAGTFKVNLVRYPDDFVIAGSSKELLGTEVKPRVERFLCARGLERSQKKTTIMHVAEGFDFLGQNVRKSGTAIIITLSNKNVLAFKTKIRALFPDPQNSEAGKPDRSS